MREQQLPVMLACVSRISMRAGLVNEVCERLVAVEVVHAVAEGEVEDLLELAYVLSSG